MWPWDLSSRGIRILEYVHGIRKGRLKARIAGKESELEAEKEGWSWKEKRKKDGAWRREREGLDGERSNGHISWGGAAELSGCGLSQQPGFLEV